VTITRYEIAQTILTPSGLTEQRTPSIHSFEPRDSREVPREREGFAHEGGVRGRIAGFFLDSGVAAPRQREQRKDEQTYVAIFPSTAT
jgi:hypothetical protein